MLNLDYDAAHRFVEGYPQAHWDGWDIVIFKPTPTGMTRSDGAFVDGEWGRETRISCDNLGRWRLRV